jgi:lipid A 3-O-deacylase
MYKTCLRIFLLLFCSVSSYVHALDSLRWGNYPQFKFLYANDVYNGTDRYLTQYIQFSYLGRYKPGKRTSMTQNEYSLQQNVYTPSDIFGDSIQKDDRPYASLLFAGFKKRYFHEQHKASISKGIFLGIIGRHGFGEDMQREIHHAVNSRQALGWKYQLKDAPYVQTKLQGDKGMAQAKHLDWILLGEANIGTVFNDLSLGQTIRLHIKDPYFPVFNHWGKSIRLKVEMRNQIRLVAHNGTLQGAIGSRNNHYVLAAEQISRIVQHHQFNLSFAVRRFSVEISETFVSKEFQTGLKHAWGHVAFTYTH